PLDLDAPFRMLGEVQYVRAVGTVDRDAAAARDVADHVVARHRLAALRVPDERVVESLHPDAAPVSAHTLDQPLERASGLGDRRLLAREQFLHDRGLPE